MKRQYPSRIPRGYINILLIPLIVSILFFIVTAGFAFWAYNSREDYRKNVEDKIAVAVAAAKKEEGIRKDQEHAEADKQPLKTYAGPDQFGSIRVTYPKTWSGYVSDTGNGNQPLTGYFHPGVVPDTTAQASTFALHVNLVNQTYPQIIQALQNSVSAGTVKAAPYAFPKVPAVIGSKFEGQILPNKKNSGTMIVVPLRDKTLQVWTDSPVYQADFNNLILPNFSFSP